MKDLHPYLCGTQTLTRKCSQMHMHEFTSAHMPLHIPAHTSMHMSMDMHVHSQGRIIHLARPIRGRLSHTCHAHTFVHVSARTSPARPTRSSSTALLAKSAGTESGSQGQNTTGLSATAARAVRLAAWPRPGAECCSTFTSPKRCVV